MLYHWLIRLRLNFIIPFRKTKTAASSMYTLIKYCNTTYIIAIVHLPPPDSFNDLMATIIKHCKTTSWWQQLNHRVQRVAQGANELSLNTSMVNQHWTSLVKLMISPATFSRLLNLFLFDTLRLPYQATCLLSNNNNNKEVYHKYIWIMHVILTWSDFL